mgnify:CR=1|jgi:ankyrin repeat protein
MGNVFGPTNYDLEEKVIQGDLVGVQQALRDGASLEYKNHYGWTALHFASYKANLDITKLLLDKGANLDAMNNDKNLPVDICGYDCRDKEQIKKTLAIFRETASRREMERFRSNHSN